uniref:Fetuin-B-like n=1 Tax=Sphaeramia orbicularis TaxID=375764 RepID=A0A672YX89_9TELE
MRVYVLVLCVFVLQQRTRARPESPGCNSPEAVRVAEESVEQINQDRTHGYILSLNRLYDLSEKGGLLYQMTLDVMETKCHITSRKPWKTCDARQLHEVPVYGECEVSVHVDSQVQLQSYSCGLRQVPATAVVDTCPDCPTAENLNEPVVKETANLSLQRFNEESRLTNIFTLEDITKASSQWVVGPAYFVEFTIVETVCSKTNDGSEVSSCPPMDCQFAHRGFCVGSHVTQEEEFEIRAPVGVKNQKPVVEVKCEIFEPQAAVAEEQAHAKAASGHTEHQHLNHTHLHPHEHPHSDTPTSDHTDPGPRSSLGTVVDQPASPRSAPHASSCPSPHRHNLGLVKLRL